MNSSLSVSRLWNAAAGRCQFLSSAWVQQPVREASREITNYSLMKGKQKSSKAVLDRFFRLNWGIWIRTKAGRDKHLWKKSEGQKWLLRQHVFTNATQTRLLDRMVTANWRRPRYWVDDPYLPYQERENFSSTRKRPLP